MDDLGGSGRAWKRFLDLFYNFYRMPTVLLFKIELDIILIGYVLRIFKQFSWARLFLEIQKIM